MRALAGRRCAGDGILAINWLQLAYSAADCSPPDFADLGMPTGFRYEKAMEAEIRYPHTSDIDPGTFVAEDPDRFTFMVQLIVSPADGESGESFGFEVSTLDGCGSGSGSKGPSTAVTR